MAQRDRRRSLMSEQRSFSRISEQASYKSNQDATIDIPLTQVTTQSNYNEKSDGGGIAGGSRGRKRGTDDGEGNPLTAMGRIYDRIYNFSILTRYMLLVAPLGILLAVPIVIGATAAPNARIGPHAVGLAVHLNPRIVWLFTWVEVVWLGLWGSKLFAKCLPKLFQVLAGAVSPGVRKYSLAIKRLEVPITLVFWFLIALTTFIPLMTLNPDMIRDNSNPTITAALPDHSATVAQSWEKTIQSILTGLLIASLIFLGEKVFIVLVSVQYHQQTFERKIKESKRSIDLISYLLDASHALFEPYCPEFADEDYIINDSIGLGGPGRHGRPGAATPMRLLHNVGRFGDKITEAFGKVAHEVTGTNVFNVSASHSIVVEALERKRSSEALARRLWMSLVVEKKNALYQEDVIEVLADHTQQEAIEAFAAVDKDGNGDVTLDEMILTICEMGRERKAIANSLHSIDSCITVLDRLLLLVVFFAIIFVFISILSTSTVSLLAAAGTTLLSLSFIFSSTIAEVFSSCIFLFVKHPFDVDDNVTICGNSLIVERISLLFTVFRNIQTHAITQAPNSALSTLWIDNVSRSGKMRELLLIYVSFDTSLEDVEALRKELQRFVNEKDNARDFDGLEVEITGIAEMNKMELKVEIQHKSNWQNETLRAARRSKFMCALVLALRKVPIYAPGGGGAALGSADQPTYSVSVNDADAAAAREAFKNAKEAKRMNTVSMPSKLDLPAGVDGGATSGADLGSSSSTLHNRSGGFLATNAETTALTALAARSPASDPSRDWDNSDTRNGPLSPRADRGFGTPMSPQQSNEVDNLLRRKSTLGKRQSNNSDTAQTGPVSELPRLDYQTYFAPSPKAKQISDGPTRKLPLPPRPTYQGGSPPRDQSPQARDQSPEMQQYGASGVVTFPSPPRSTGQYSQRKAPAQPRYEHPPSVAGSETGGVPVPKTLASQGREMSDSRSGPYGTERADMGPS